jgi:hypothetical protein
VLSQRLVTDEVVQVVQVKNLVIQKERDRYFTLPKEISRMASFLDERVSNFSKNIIFITDLAFNIIPDHNTCSAKLRKDKKDEGKKKEKGSKKKPEQPEPPELDPAKLVPPKMKNSHVANFWHALDLDLYYGANKYQTSLTALFPHTMRSRPVDELNQNYLDY